MTMPTTYDPIANSTFLEYSGYGIADQNQTVSQAYQMTDGGDFPNGSSYGINVAIVLDRANDPTALLSSDWGTRQTTIAAMNTAGTLWTTYGADVGQYNTAVTTLQGLGLTVLLLLAVVRTDLLNEWKQSLPVNAPNHFLINIPPNETGSLTQYLVSHGIEAPELSPWVRARLTAVNDQPMSDSRKI